LSELTCDVVFESHTTITDDFQRVARHLVLSELAVIHKIRVSHGYCLANTVCGISETVRWFWLTWSPITSFPSGVT
jgi:hypothetical protein